jgi:hypothetical protein
MGALEALQRPASEGAILAGELNPRTCGDDPCLQAQARISDHLRYFYAFPGRPSLRRLQGHNEGLTKHEGDPMLGLRARIIDHPERA